MYTEDKKVSKRVEWIDCVKGIAIILVILGHTVSNYMNGRCTRAVIYSFHMPLLFILSALTFRCSQDDGQFISKTKKAARHLLTPALVVFALIIMYDLIIHPESLIKLEFWQERIYRLIYSSGVPMEFNHIKIEPIGIIWFFVVLFCGRSIFDYIHLKYSEGQLFVQCMILGVIGVILGKIRWMPFSLDIALAVVPFFYAGYKMKNYKVEDRAWKKLIVSGAVFILTFLLIFTNYENRTYLELACRRYTLFPICYITAIAGTLFMSELCFLLTRLGKVVIPVIYIGKNSLYLLCIHIMDFAWKEIWVVNNRQFCSAFRRIIVDMIFFAVFMLIKNICSSIKSKPINIERTSK